jgi:tetratricopeptide (TPR) repeat protein
MLSSRLICAAILIATVLPRTAPAAAADQYWTYSLKDVDVTSYIGPDRAKLIAHNFNRLDMVLAGTLNAQRASWRPATHVYEVPMRIFEMITGNRTGVTSQYTVNPYATTIVIARADNNDRAFYGAYFGYAGSLLSSGYSFRYPIWFIKGLSDMVASSTVQLREVIIGSFEPARVYPLLHQPLIPIRTMLSIREDDPQLKSAEYQYLYDAECWFLVHQIMMERFYQPNFVQYFSRLDQGEDEIQAFAESFEVSYGDLDSALLAARSSKLVKLITFKVPDEPDDAAARRMEGAEAAGQLAMLAARRVGNSDDVLKLANEALAVDPNNPDALGARARVQIRAHDYTAAKHTTDHLCASDPPSKGAAAQCGYLYAELIRSGVEKDAALGMNAAAMAERSRRDYEAAIAANPEDLESWAGLSDLLNETRDVSNARAFLPRIRHAWALHARNTALARAAALMCAETGDYDCAIKFAVVWEKTALNGSGRAVADAYLSRLRTASEHKSLTGTADDTIPATNKVPP